MLIIHLTGKDCKRGRFAAVNERYLRGRRVGNMTQVGDVGCKHSSWCAFPGGKELLCNLKRLRLMANEVYLATRAPRRLSSWHPLGPLPVWTGYTRS